MKRKKKQKKHESVYIIGSGEAPNWCKNRLMAYLKPDGSTGFEFHGYLKTFELLPGDMLLKAGKRIDIERAVAT